MNGDGVWMRIYFNEFVRRMDASEMAGGPAPETDDDAFDPLAM